MDSTLAWKKFANKQTPSTVTIDNLFYENIPKRSKILDFGCAWGRVSFELQEKGYNVVGFDINQSEILIAQKLAIESNKKYISQVKFDNENALELPYEDNSFDACLMQTFMATLTNPKHRTDVLDEAKRVLKKDGILYISDFAQNWQNTKYKQRYEEHFLITKEIGTFIVTKKGTTEEIYRVHHYTKKELEDLLNPRFDDLTIKDTIFTSYHGNQANGFIVIAKK
jgi:ubiquinone/menaquinone biosynthesis C-methylase UbiE